ncbi:MAG: hypothetical protein IPJ94_17735 [Chloroflexi bacterium]|nr:hypothetical protein [Chloroflexota bacterium]
MTDDKAIPLGTFVREYKLGRETAVHAATLPCPISRSQVQLTPMMQGSTDDWRRE